MTEQIRESIEIPEDMKLSKTYKEVAHEFIEAEKQHFEGDGSMETESIISFAEYLDSKNVMSDQFTLLAMEQARKIDREFILLLIEAVGLPKAKEIALQVTNNHKHTKTCPPEVQNQSEEEKKSTD